MNDAAPLPPLKVAIAEIWRREMDRPRQVAALLMVAAAVVGGALAASYQSNGGPFLGWLIAVYSVSAFAGGVIRFRGEGVTRAMAWGLLNSARVVAWFGLFLATLWLVEATGIAPAIDGSVALALVFGLIILAMILSVRSDLYRWVIAGLALLAAVIVSAFAIRAEGSAVHTAALIILLSSGLPFLVITVRGVRYMRQAEWESR